jgi:5-methylcytosine-specific restriction endonuclease McrA
LVLHSACNLKRARKRERDKARYARCRDAILAQKKDYREKNAAECRERQRAHYRRHKGRYLHRNAQRKAWVAKATPRWADHLAMEAIYTQALQRTLDTGITHSVDHIVPLRHPLVCGLHCPANLQVLTMEDNRAKGNSFTPG